MENEIPQNIPQGQILPQTSVSLPTPPSANWSKILLLIVLGLVIVAGSIFIGIQVGKNQAETENRNLSNNNPKVVQGPVTPNYANKTSETQRCAYESLVKEEFKDINEYKDIKDCDNDYLQWETSSSSGLFSLKHPIYYKQIMDYGADSFEIKHPTLGRFLTGSFGGDLNEDYNSLTKKLCLLSELGHISKNPEDNSYYKDDSKTYYVIGTDRMVMSENETPNIWGFSVTDQKSNKEEQLTSTDDFKCFIRSIVLL